jgi:polyphenol oxidase
MEFLKFNLLEKIPDLVHFVTRCEGGVSNGRYAALNLSTRVGDNPEHVQENRSRLKDALGIPQDHIFFPDQCHTDRIREIGELTPQDELKETDGLITSEKGLCLCILTADCVPVLLYDPKQRAIAALHAGWRGTYKRIVCRAVERMVKTYGSNPEHILACIGPAISQECYEVGEDVSGHFRFLFSDHPEVVRKSSQNGKDHIDLKESNSILLQRSGIKSNHIEISPVCTYSSSAQYFSARRDGIESGRFASGIMLV